MLEGMIANLKIGEGVTCIQDLFSDSDGSLHIRLPARKRKVQLKRRKKQNTQVESPINSNTRSINETVTSSNENCEDNSSDWKTVNTTEDKTIFSSTRYNALGDRTNKLEIISVYSGSALEAASTGEQLEENDKNQFTYSVHSDRHSVSADKVVKTLRNAQDRQREQIASLDSDVSGSGQEVDLVASSTTLQSASDIEGDVDPSSVVEPTARESGDVARESYTKSGFLSTPDVSLRPRPSNRRMSKRLRLSSDSPNIASAQLQTGHNSVSGFADSAGGIGSTYNLEVTDDAESDAAQRNSSVGTVNTPFNSMDGRPSVDRHSMESNDVGNMNGHSGMTEENSIRRSQTYIAQPNNSRVPGPSFTKNSETYIAERNASVSASGKLVNSIHLSNEHHSSMEDSEVDDRNNNPYETKKNLMKANGTYIAPRHSSVGTNRATNNSIDIHSSIDESSMDGTNTENVNDHVSAAGSDAYVSDHPSDAEQGSIINNSSNDLEATAQHSPSNQPSTLDDTGTELRRSKRSTTNLRGSYVDKVYQSLDSSNSMLTSGTNSLVKRKSTIESKKKKSAASKKPVKSRYSVFESELSSMSSSPKHYGETTQSKTPKPSRKKYMGLFGEKVYSTPKPIIPESNEGCNLRRSKRTRLPPLRRYAGELPMYTLDEVTGAQVITGVTKAPPEDDFVLQFMFQSQLHGKPKKRKLKTKKSESKRRASINVTLDSDASSSDGEVPVIDELTQEKVFRVVTARDRVSDFINLEGTFAGNDDPVRMSKTFESPTLSYGILLIEGLAGKPESLLRGYQLGFKVEYGAVMLTLNRESKKIVRDGGFFLIPSGNSYELKNLGKSTLKLSFTLTHVR